MGEEISGRSIRLFLADGNPNGVVTAEIMNWSGHVIAAPRSKIPELLRREELRRTGVYFLSGPDPETGRTNVYIGESDEVGKRLKGHAQDPGKDFWERTCLVTSKDQNLTKAHVRYLESRLIEIARSEGRANVMNATFPEGIRLPEADLSDMEYFISQIRLMLPVLGMDFLRPRLSEIQAKEPSEVLFELSSHKHGIHAEAREVNDEFFVLQGSLAQANWIGAGSEETSYARLHSQLRKDGKLISEGKGLARFSEDTPFRSPSAASAVVYLSADFQELWDRIKHRTRYRVTFETPDLIERALARIKKNIEPIKAPRVATTVVEVDISDAGVTADKQIATRVRAAEPVKVLPDILAFLQKETELTRHTLADILKRSGRLAEFKINPQAFMAVIAKEISRALHDLMLEGIKYEKVAGAYWEQSRIEQDAEEGIVRYLSNLYEVQNRDKSLFDAVEYESEVEKEFARDLDNNENVKLFVKLPSWFKIDTPIGPYNPDWAFVTEREEKLYFVRETKSTLDNEDLRTKENQKIDCGKRHFETLGVDYGVVTSLTEVVM